MTGPRRPPICSPVNSEDRAVVDEFMAYLAARKVVRDYENQPEVGARAAFTRLRADLERVTAQRDRDRADAARDGAALRRVASEMYAIELKASLLADHHRYDCTIRCGCGLDYHAAAVEIAIRIRTAIKEPTQ